VPGADEQSLYVRPFMFATEVGLGIRPAKEYLFMVIASPVGAYFAGGVKPVSVWLSEEYVRAVPGGTGEAKTGGNYAGSLLAQAQASEHGCDQVVWLDAIERSWIEEMGGMNLYFVCGAAAGGKPKILTPALTGSLLPGITRDSVMRIAAYLGYEVNECRISVEDWERGCADGSITEVFACGTAAVITPVSSVKCTRAGWTVADGNPGEVTMKLRAALLAIQAGTAPDPHGWMHQIR
jgi:branched-chain amino acid aminotransferase